ncbi:hypothetical protein AKJ44_01505 [candidate division MSBL1 archaeon SCGC-AAA261F17]|uniref:DUF5678 domain-containing protein n=2 Tax=candidate division MSBL1 TaxID=215777 RepID=A0A133V6I3_9EURY|nr:hypothetical protein AKJ44_01505 [candidate division MSBL1 archaeon SCGC-AAA261F17]KXB03943.1 hypothetical protein AKJ47_01400 [candidate division MSBL1 archaeon SCGC-AAA261G05]
MSETKGMLSQYLETERKFEGKWFALKGGELIALADTNGELWGKLRELDARDVLIGYAPTKAEREADCLYVIFR